MFFALFSWLVAPCFAQPNPVLVQSLSARHAAPSCAALTATVEELAEVVTNVTMPPWVPMRAATCLIEQHAEASEAHFLSWITEPEQLGLGRLLLRRLDGLDDALALRIVQTGIDGPLRDEVIHTASQDPRPELQQRAASALGTP